MENLKPCPFCGHFAVVRKDQGGWFVRCDNLKDCPVFPTTFGFSTEEEAIVAWNRRVAPKEDKNEEAS